MQPEQEAVLDARTLKRRQCNADKRQRVGDVAFRKEKTDARKKQRAAKRAAARTPKAMAAADSDVGDDVTSITDDVPPPDALPPSPPLPPSSPPSRSLWAWPWSSAAVPSAVDGARKP